MGQENNKVEVRSKKDLKKIPRGDRKPRTDPDSLRKTFGWPLDKGGRDFEPGYGPELHT